MSRPDIEELRRNVDQIDQQLVELIGARMQHVDQILALKCLAGLPRRCEEREREILERIRAASRQQGLDPELVEALFKRFFNQASSYPKATA